MNSVLCVVITSDDRYIVSGSYKTIKIWDFRNKTELHSYIEAHEKSVRSLVITSDDKYIVSGSSDKSIKIWDL